MIEPKIFIENSEIRAACKFCQANPCSCPREIKKIRIELEKEEERYRYALIDYKYGKFAYRARLFLPQYYLSQCIYLLVGGRQNPVWAVLISTNITQLILHHFFPRFISFLQTGKTRFAPDQYDIMIYILLTVPMSTYFVWEKLRQIKLFSSLYQKIQESRNKKIDKIRQCLELDSDIVNRFIEHTENKLCFTHSEFKHNKLVMLFLIFPLLRSLPKATEPLHMITTESKMANVDSVFTFVKKSTLNTGSSFWRVIKKINCPEFKKISQKSACVIL